MTTVWTRVDQTIGTHWSNVSVVRPGDAQTTWDGGLTTWDLIGNVFETFWDPATARTIWTKVSP